MAVSADAGTLQQDVAHPVLPHLFEEVSDGRHQDVEAVEVELRVHGGHLADVLGGEADSCAGLPKEIPDSFFPIILLSSFFG